MHGAFAEFCDERNGKALRIVDEMHLIFRSNCQNCRLSPTSVDMLCHQAMIEYDQQNLLERLVNGFHRFAFHFFRHKIRQTPHAFFWIERHTHVHPRILFRCISRNK